MIQKNHPYSPSLNAPPHLSSQADDTADLRDPTVAQSARSALHAPINQQLTDRIKRRPFVDLPQVADRVKLRQLVLQAAYKN